MSHVDTQTSWQKPRADRIILGLLAILICGALFFALTQRQQVLRNSPAGLDGLHAWLSSEGIDVQSFVGGWPINADDVGLLILPLYDTVPDQSHVPPRTQEELILQQDEYDLGMDAILAKAGEVPTLIVLPKWRSGMRLTGFAHPVLHVDRAPVLETLRDVVDAGKIGLTYAQFPFVTFADPENSSPKQEALIYAAQMLQSSTCRPLLGTQDAMILAECPLAEPNDQDSVFVLSDPDLINNHGLTLGDNAFLIRDLVSDLAGDQQVIIDYSRDNWLTREEDRVARERTWSDLLRFFSPPFTLIWVGLVIATGLTLWRSGVRFGPLKHMRSALGASKMMAIGARARLMRLSNRDGALAKDYCKARLAAVATTLFGAAHARQISTPETFLAFVRRRHPARAQALAETLNVIQALPAGATAAQAMSTLSDLDRLLEQIIHDT